jgi:ribosomal subunit interface protein
MEIIITGSAFDTGLSVKNHITEKLNNMSKKLNSKNVHKVHLVLNKDGINFLSRIDVIKEIGQKPILHSSAEAADPYHCVDSSIKKIEDQILKYKNKEMSKTKHDGMVTKELVHHSDDLEIVDAIYEVIE